MTDLQREKSSTGNNILDTENIKTIDKRSDDDNRGSEEGRKESKYSEKHRGKNPKTMEEEEDDEEEEEVEDE